MLWSLVVFLALRGFAVAEWAGSAPGQSVLAALGSLTVAGLYLLVSGTWTAVERAVLQRRVVAVG